MDLTDVTQALEPLEATRLGSNPSADADVVSLPVASSIPANAAAPKAPVPQVLPLPATAADSATQ